MLMIHANLFRTAECTGQATKTNMILFYNKRNRGMYGCKKHVWF